MPGVICEKQFPKELNNKIYKTATIPTMTYGGECWAIRNCEQTQTNTTEMKMLRWIHEKKQEKITPENVIIREIIIKCMYSRCRRDEIHVCFAYASPQCMPDM